MYYTGWVFRILLTDVQLFKKCRGLSGRCAPLTFYKLLVSWSVRPMCSVYVFKLKCSMKVSNPTLITYYSLLFIFYKLNQTTRIQRIHKLIFLLNSVLTSYPKYDSQEFQTTVSFSTRHTQFYLLFFYGCTLGLQ